MVHRPNGKEGGKFRASAAVSLKTWGGAGDLQTPRYLRNKVPETLNYLTPLFVNCNCE
jgi:hypothetical protein